MIAKKFSVTNHIGGVSAIVLCTIVGCLNAGWWRTYGSEGDETGHCVRQTTDGGYIISGYSEPLGGCWLIKTDDVGQVMWTKSFEGGAGRCLRKTEDGGYVFLVGSRTVRTDGNGDSIWGKSKFPITSSVEWLEYIPGEGYAYTGNWYELSSDQCNYIELDNHFFKIDLEGNITIEKKWDGLQWGTWGYFIRQTSDGGFVIAGLSYDIESTLMKIDSTGDRQWVKRSIEGCRGQVECVQQTIDGGFVFCTSQNLAKTDSSGNVLWSKPWEGICVQTTSDGGYILVGAYRESSGDDYDIRLLKTDSLGDTMWTRLYGGEENEATWYGSRMWVEQTSDGGYIVVGSTKSFGAGGSDIYLIKTDSLGLLSIEESDFPESQHAWQVAVPIGRNITLRAPQGSAPLDLAVFDASGRQVDKINLTSGTTNWGEGFSPGVYFIRESSGKSPLTHKVILVK